MIDNRAEIYSILFSVSNNVDYRYPLNLLDKNYPKLCYFTSGIEEKAYQDNASSMCSIDTTVQAYEKTIEGELVEIHADIIKAMKKNGFLLSYYDNYYDTEDNMCIHTMRFKKIYEEEEEKVNE